MGDHSKNVSLLPRLVNTSSPKRKNL